MYETLKNEYPNPNCIKFSGSTTFGKDFVSDPKQGNSNIHIFTEETLEFLKYSYFKFWKLYLHLNTTAECLLIFGTSCQLKYNLSKALVLENWTETAKSDAELW